MPRMRKPRDLPPKGPIIIIGAGRSGSTLLHAMLDAHPDIRMLGEFEYATFDLWRAFWLREAPAQELARRAAAKAEAHAPKRASGKGRSSVMSAPKYSRSSVWRARCSGERSMSTSADCNRLQERSRTAPQSQSGGGPVYAARIR